MKKTLGAIVAVGAIATAGQVLAAENWSTRLPGATEGLAVGALPPEGVYFVNDAIWCTTHAYDNSGHSTQTRVNAFINVPMLQWVPGVKILGADYAVAFAQAFDYVNVTNGATTSQTGTNLGSGFGWFDTLIQPAVLSWALPHDFHVSTQFGVWLPDGSKDTSRMLVQTSNRYWALEPGVGISWLHDGWSANLLLLYDVNFDKSADNSLGLTNYKNYGSGDQFQAEYSVSKTIGKWSFGVGGYAMQQVEKDEVTLANGTKTHLVNSEAARYALGPMVGYNFGPVAVQAYYQQQVKTENYVGGNEFWTRIVAPF